MSVEDVTVSLSSMSSKLTEDKLKSYLQDVYGTNTEFVRYEIKDGSAKGDSYLSSVYRIEVEGIHTKDGSKAILPLIVKCLPESLARRRTFRSAEFFINEVAFYNKVVPIFHEFQTKQKPKTPFKEFPRCFFALADGQNDVVVLEDMSFKNFRTAGRQDGLSFELCDSILQLLGRFHALSLAMKHKQPEAFREASSSLFETYYKTEIKSWYIDQLHLFTEIAMDAVSKELPEKIYEEKLQEFTDNSCYEKMCEFVKPKEPYSVITHGDAWAPNFLMRYACDDKESSDKVEELCMIDYQTARYASPILDISFFLYSCASEGVLFGQFDNILKSYYKSLSDFMSDLGSSSEVMLPFTDFQNEIVSYFAYGLGMSLESVPLSIVDDQDAPDLEAIIGNDAVPLTQVWALKPIKSKEGRKRLANNVKHAVDNGYI